MGRHFLGDNKTYVIPKKTKRFSIHIGTICMNASGIKLNFLLKFIRACISQPKENGFPKIIFQLRFYLWYYSNLIFSAYECKRMN